MYRYVPKLRTRALTLNIINPVPKSYRSELFDDRCRSHTACSIDLQYRYCTTLLALLSLRVKYKWKDPELFISYTYAAVYAQSPRPGSIYFVFTHVQYTVRAVQLYSRGIFNSHFYADCTHSIELPMNY